MSTQPHPDTASDSSAGSPNPLSSPLLDTLYSTATCGTPLANAMLTRMPQAPTLSLLLLLLLSLSAVLVSAQEDGFVYTGFRGGAAASSSNKQSISLNGDAEIEDNGILRLTNVTSRLLGRAFYPLPLRFRNATDGSAFSFSAAFALAIVPQYPNLGGHGLAFVVAPTKELRSGLPSQYLGLLNDGVDGNYSNHLFFVEFDTVRDFDFGDINDNHVGVNINAMRSKASTTAAYYDGATKRDVNLKDGNTIQAWIDYDGVAKLLNVTLSYSSSKPSTPLISYPVDLSPILLDSMFVGFSASTGLLASSHYLMGWSFKMNGVAQSLDLSTLPSLPRPKKKGSTFAIAFSVTAFVLLVAAAIGGFLYYRIKNADVIEAWELHYGPHRFLYKELKKATKGFREKELLGFGGFGKVYKGTLPSPKAPVAVKRISNESRQGIQEFVAEIASIGRLRHRNLVQLQGWCRRRGDLLLVYDYMPNGSLDRYLFDDPPKMVLSWSQRFKIIRGVASALLYLHEEWEHVVIHRDVKASNVLLDADMNGRLGDFGMAKLYDHGSNPGTTRVVGTLGYLAPELTRTGKPTTSSDVFAFGAMMLEVVCGRRPVEPKALPEELILVDWVWNLWEAGHVEDVVDRRLVGDYAKEEVETVVRVGLLCSHPSPCQRPSMRDVIRYLDGDTGVPDQSSPPADDAKSHVGFDDYVHSYPSSSFEKASPSSVVTDRGEGLDTAAPAGPGGEWAYSLLPRLSRGSST